MYKFLARRIHDGHMTWDEVPTKYLKKVQDAYKEMYGEESTGN